MRNVVKPRWVIVVRCLSCRRRGVIPEGDLVRFGIELGAPVAQFVNDCAAGNAAAAASWRADAARVAI
jgi:hypothetical protein